MPANNTAPHKLTADDGTEITVGIPVGEIKEPTERAKEQWALMQDERGWKFATRSLVTSDKELAEEVAHCLAFYTGGYEMAEGDGRISVWSKGYYEYIGS